jgi:N-acetylmuramoyl-L-alanine amidase
MDQIIDSPSPNFSERLAPVSMLVLHYTGMEDAASAIAWLRNPVSKVSCHYLVAEDGQILRMVDEDKRAWHAGNSHWRGITDVNSASIGIEIVNPGHEWGYRAFPEGQMAAVEGLCRDVLSRHRIPPYRIVGHSDIAPDRKSDPGELFEWRRLAENGIGLWPSPAAELVRRRGRGVGVIERAAALADLARIGYCVGAATVQVAVAAFQRRFRPERWDGLIDSETRVRLKQVREAAEAARIEAEAARRRRYN